MKKITIFLFLYFLAEAVAAVTFVRLFGFLDLFLYTLSAGMLGIALATMLGRQGWRELQLNVAAGKMPGARMLSKLLLVIGSFLVLLPGLLNDVVGFLLILPGFHQLWVWVLRVFLWKFISLRIVGMSAHMGASMPGSGGTRRAASDGTIDVEHTRVK